MSRRRRSPIRRPPDTAPSRGPSPVGWRRRARGALLCLLVLTLHPSVRALAQLGGPVRSVALPTRAAGCGGGLLNDDGSFESSVWSPSMVSRFVAPTGEARFTTICVCWLGIASTPATIEYDLILLAADGPGGEPGTELGRVSASASDVSAQMRFFEHDVTSMELEVPDEPFYLGVATDWGASRAFICTDTQDPSGQPTYLANSAGAWSVLAMETLGVRADLRASGSCVPGPERLCIDDQPADRRFEVTLRYETTQGGGSSGAGVATPLASLGITEGGIFSFFSPTNPEMLVKVLDGCSFNGHYWIFFAATTTVGFELTVRDTANGTERTYENPDEKAAAPVTDVTAFPCP